MVKVGIVGASGYTGAELIRLLANHPEVKVVAATSESFAGQQLSDIYPALGSLGNITLRKLADTDLSAAAVDLLFLGLPHGESMAIAPQLVKTGVKIVDLSGDFRFKDVSVYETWYKHKHSAKELAAKAIYGLPELFREDIKSAELVANPGCYVTSVVLGCLPLVQGNAVDPGMLVADAKSGISGAGRKVKPETHFNRISENVVPYKVGGVHQHTPEMEMALSHVAGQTVAVTFTPQLVPARRGIVTIIYGKLLKSYTNGELCHLYEKTYQHEPFVTVLPEKAAWPDMSCAVGSNQCVIKVTQDTRTGLVVVASALDNLIKGASGQAIQNMNLMLGLEETLGLPRAGLIP